MEVLHNFSLNRPYKFILYLSSIILVLSFITKPPDIDTTELRWTCVLITASGVVAWIVDEIYTSEMNDKDRDAVSDNNYTIYRLSMYALNILYFIVSLAITIR